MPTIVHEFSWPDRLVVGTVGRPGERAFYLQARTKARFVTVALEKEQSALLAQKIDEMLDELKSTESNPFRIPDSTPIELVDNDPLDQPLDTQFRTGAIGLGWDPTTARLRPGITVGGLRGEVTGGRSPCGGLRTGRLRWPDQGCDLRAGAVPELPEDRLDVVCHGPGRQHELACYLVVAQARPDQDRHLTLTGREGAERRLNRQPRSTILALALLRR